MRTSGHRFTAPAEPVGIPWSQAVYPAVVSLPSVMTAWETQSEGGHSTSMEHSRIVVLNGAPSSGKTTISSAFRDERASVGDFWLLTGIDDYLAKLPAEWRSVGGRGGSYAVDGIRFEDVEGDVHVSVGSVGRLLLRGYQASVAAAGRTGLNVMVDEVVVDRTSWEDWGIALAGLDVVWVGIRCAAELAEERNRARGDDRYAGLASALTVAAHRDATYDFEIDTTALTPRDALEELTHHLGYRVDVSVA